MVSDKGGMAWVFTGEDFFWKSDLMKWFHFTLPEPSRFQHVKVTWSFNIVYSTGTDLLENSFVTHGVMKIRQFILLKLGKKFFKLMSILLNELYFSGMCRRGRDATQIGVHFLTGTFHFKYRVFGLLDDLYYP